MSMKIECPKCGETSRSRLTCIDGSLRCETCDTKFVIGEGIENHDYTNAIMIPVEEAFAAAYISIS
jgi:ribosomal protein L37AE/L43A